MKDNFTFDIPANIKIEQDDFAFANINGVLIMPETIDLKLSRLALLNKIDLKNLDKVELRKHYESKLTLYSEIL